MRKRLRKSIGRDVLLGSTFIREYRGGTTTSATTAHSAPSWPARASARSRRILAALVDEISGQDVLKAGFKNGEQRHSCPARVDKHVGPPHRVCWRLEHQLVRRRSLVYGGHRRRAEPLPQLRHLLDVVWQLEERLGVRVDHVVEGRERVCGRADIALKAFAAVNGFLVSSKSTRESQSEP